MVFPEIEYVFDFAYITPPTTLFADNVNFVVRDGTIDTKQQSPSDEMAYMSSFE